MKRLFKNIICAVLAPVALVSCMDLDENVYDKLAQLHKSVAI